MDRRRKLLILFVVVFVVAVLDMQANGVDIFDQWGRLFEIRAEGITPGDPWRFAQVAATYTRSHSAEGMEQFVLQGGTGLIFIYGADTDEVTVETKVHTLADAVQLARRYAEGFDITLRAEDGTLRAGWEAPEQPENLRLAQLTWTVTLPRDMGVTVEQAYGYTAVRDIAGPVHVDAPTNLGVELQPVAAAPVHIRARGGDVRVILARETMNYDVQATTRFGSLNVRFDGADSPLLGLERVREGNMVKLTGALGDGEFPLVIDMTGNIDIFEPPRD